jgi:hypothetical protein
MTANVGIISQDNSQIVPLQTVKLHQKSIAVIFEYYSGKVFTIVAILGEKRVTCVI